MSSLARMLTFFEGGEGAECGGGFIGIAAESGRCADTDGIDGDRGEGFTGAADVLREREIWGGGEEECCCCCWMLRWRTQWRSEMGGCP